MTSNSSVLTQQLPIRSRVVRPSVGLSLAIDRSIDVPDKAASSPSKVPVPALENAGFVTPRHPEVLPFASPEGRSNGDAADGDWNATSGGDPSRGSFKRGFKRMLQGVPSPSHFRRSMSFSGPMSAISNAANRVATGAMTPIRIARHRRQESKDSSEGSGSVAGEETSSSIERSSGISKHRANRSVGGNFGEVSSKAGSSSYKNGAKKHKRGRSNGSRRAEGVEGGAGGGAGDSYGPTQLFSSLWSSPGSEGCSERASTSSRSHENGSSFSRFFDDRNSSRSRERSSRSKGKASSSSGRKHRRASSAVSSLAAVGASKPGTEFPAASMPSPSEDGSDTESQMAADVKCKTWSWESPTTLRAEGSTGGSGGDSAVQQQQQQRVQQPGGGERAERADSSSTTGSARPSSGGIRQEGTIGRPPSHDGEKS